MSYELPHERQFKALTFCLFINFPDVSPAAVRSTNLPPSNLMSVFYHFSYFTSNVRSLGSLISTFEGSTRKISKRKRNRGS